MTPALPRQGAHWDIGLAHGLVRVTLPPPLLLVLAEIGVADRLPLLCESTGGVDFLLPHPRGYPPRNAHRY